MKQVLFYGDSNTWGLIPGTHPYQRYPRGVRWTSIVQERSSGKLQVIEEGLCGRTTVFEDELRPGRSGIEALPLILEKHRPLDYAVLMLGTNDCKTIYHATPEIIGSGVRRCLQKLMEEIPKENILLISPILFGKNVFLPEKDPEFGQESVALSYGLKSVYEKIAGSFGCEFLAGSDIALPSDIDDEHLDEEGHRIFAEAVLQKLSAMQVL